MTNQTAFTKYDEKLLHGREEEVADIIQNCLAERLTVVTSELGLGVTSLLNAGVAPALKREGFIVAVFSAWPVRKSANIFKSAVELRSTVQAQARTHLDTRLLIHGYIL